MGLNICGIAINSLPEITDTKSLDKRKLKVKYIKSKLKQLSPKNLSISFKSNCTLIFLDMIFYQNISEEKELTDLEKDIAAIFPGSRFLIFVINDIIDFTGYSFVDNGLKIRTKVVVKNDIFLDYGDLTAIENKLYGQFQTLYKDKVETYNKIEEGFSSLNTVDRKKAYLKLRDSVYNQNKIANKYNYTDGSLDSFTIEKIFSYMLGCDYFDIEQIEYCEFERRKLNFKKDSLKEYLFLAKNHLHT